VIDLAWVGMMVRRYGLQVWFAAHSTLAVANAVFDPRYWWFDGRLYLEATRSWLAGGDPWSVSIDGNYYAAPPPTLLPLVPIAVLPQPLDLVVLVMIVGLATLATIRLLALPWWWLAFPPLVQCLIAANVQALILPLILWGAGPVAAFAKAYAILPIVILGRWRAAALTAVALVVTAPLLPWAQFLDSFGVITGRLAEQTDFALPTAVLIAAAPFALLAMTLIGRDRAAWLSVPALWPSQQYYYGALAVGTRDPIAAAIVAMPLPGVGLLALFVLAAIAWRRGNRPSVAVVLGPSER
jgi:hypothetical protein